MYPERQAARLSVRGASLKHGVGFSSLLEEICPGRRVWIAEARVSPCISQGDLARQEKRHGNRYRDELAE